MLILSLLLACTGSTSPTADNGAAPGHDPSAPGFNVAPPTAAPSGPPAGPFSLTISPYPAWTTFDVADQIGLIKGGAGELGTIEKKWNVDIVLKSEADYVTTLQMFDNSTTDAVAVTNTDALALADKRNATAILATSTSFGADALIVDNGVKDWAGLKGRKISGAAQSVSDYLLFRCAQNAGVKWEDYPMENMDPSLAATDALQQAPGAKIAVVLWNPFTMNLLEGRKDVRTLCDSTSIPGEIVDMIAVGSDVLQKPGGDRFAKAIIDAYYAFDERLADPDKAKADDMLVALGEKFSKITDPNVMRRLTRETKFYSDAGQGTTVYASKVFADTWPHIAEFSTTHGLVTTVPTVVNGHDAAPPASGMWLRVDPSYMAAVGNN